MSCLVPLVSTTIPIISTATMLSKPIVAVLKFKLRRGYKIFQTDHTIMSSKSAITYVVGRNSER